MAKKTLLSPEKQKAAKNSLLKSLREFIKIPSADNYVTATREMRIWQEVIYP